MNVSRLGSELSKLLEMASSGRVSDNAKNIQTKKGKLLELPIAFMLSQFLLASFQASVVLSRSILEEPFVSINPHLLHRYDFPTDFVFGAASSAFQVEGAVNVGGRGTSVWDTRVRTPGAVIDHSNADVTSDEYHHLEEDLDLLSLMNMDAYRFSIAWTRIFPDGYGKQPNKEGIAYYNRMIDGLLKRGIKPYVTIYHWDLPQSLEDSFGGWIDRQIVKHYTDFAEECFAAFGDRVKNWITLNEPGLAARNGYFQDRLPPGRKPAPDVYPYIVAHNFLLAHGAAVDIYKKRFQAVQEGVIGMALDCTFSAPMSNSSEDKDAAQRYMEFQISWFLDPILFGDYPAVMRKYVGSRLPKFSAEEVASLSSSVDFIGLNHYTTRWATTGPGPSLNSNYSMQLDQRVTLLAERDNVTIGPKAGSFWLYMVPWGLYEALKWTSDRYSKPIYITENGMDYLGDLDLESSLRDSLRIQYHQEYLSAALDAVREGVDLRAYLAWSLLDCFEWEMGYTSRFGLIYVDYEDMQKRYPKDSAFWFKQFLDPLEVTHSETARTRAGQAGSNLFST